MTLIAGFRSVDGGVLLCADREENDGFAKREVGKIARYSHPRYQLFIAGAGSSAVIEKACAAIAKTVETASQIADFISAHEESIESALQDLHARYVRNDQEQVALLIVLAIEGDQRQVFFYRTEGPMLLDGGRYAADGSGKFIANFLADRLFKTPLSKRGLIAAACLIFREAAQSVAGVGLGAEMVLIHDGGTRTMQFFPPYCVRELQGIVPSLRSSLLSDWENNLKMPEWWKDESPAE